jgi:hypothetical protein
MSKKKMHITEGVELDLADFRRQAGLEECSGSIHNFAQTETKKAIDEGHAAASSFGYQAQKAVERMNVEIKAGDDYKARQAVIDTIKKLAYVLKGLGQKSMHQQLMNVLKTMPKV